MQSSLTPLLISVRDSMQRPPGLVTETANKLAQHTKELKEEQTAAHAKLGKRIDKVDQHLDDKVAKLHIRIANGDAMLDNKLKKISQHLDTELTRLRQDERTKQELETQKMNMNPSWPRSHRWRPTCRH